MRHVLRATSTRRVLVASLLPAIALGHAPSSPTRPGCATDDVPTPVPTGTPVTHREPILAAAYDALPAAPAAVTLTRITFPPASRVAGAGAGGPRLVVVESQAVTIVPGDGAGGTIVLTEGERLTLAAPPRELRNDGPRPAAVLIAEVVPLPAGANDVLPVPVAGGANPAVIVPSSADNPPGSPTPVPAPPVDLAALPPKPFLTEAGVLVEPLAGGAVPTLPAGPGEVVLDRLDLPAAWDEPLPVQPGPWLLLVESGQLGLDARAGTVFYRSAAASTPGALPGRAKAVALDSEVVITAGGMAFLHPAAVAVLRNRGRGTLALLALTVVPAKADVV